MQQHCFRNLEAKQRVSPRVFWRPGSLLNNKDLVSYIKDPAVTITITEWPRRIKEKQHANQDN